MLAEPGTVRRLGASLAVAAALLTSACAAGKQASTANEKPTIDGSNASVGLINLRGAVIEPPSGTTPYYPAGSDVALKIVIVNNGGTDDRLVSLTTQAAGDWGSFATTADAQAALDANASPTQPATPSSAAQGTKSGKPSPSRRTGSRSSSASSSGSTTPSGSSTQSGSTTPSESTSPPPTPARSVVIPAHGRTSWGTPEAKGALLLMHTTRRLYPGTTVQLTFTFKNAGSVSFAVPIAVSFTANTSVIPAPTTTSIER